MHEKLWVNVKDEEDNLEVTNNIEFVYNYDTATYEYNSNNEILYPLYMLKDCKYIYDVYEGEYSYYKISNIQSKPFKQSITPSKMYKKYKDKQNKLRKEYENNLLIYKVMKGEKNVNQS